MTTELIAVERKRRYHWPDAQLNFWMLIVLAGSSLCLGVFAQFMQIQTQLGLNIPWLFPYEITVGALTIVFIILLMLLIAQRQLLPGIVMMGSFILFVLWLTGLIQTAIMAYGGGESAVNSVCQTYVSGNTQSGPTLQTLAYLEQLNICNCWSAAFAFQIVLCVFFIWMMVMAYQVNRDDFD